MQRYEKEENLKLWQALTSDLIPLGDIEEAVYRDSRSDFLSKSYSANSGNLFYTYIYNTDDYEIIHLLDTAKDLEERRDNYNSPWYYPRERQYAEGASNDLSDIIDACKAYDGARLSDRYALQATRALFASRQYAACINYADSAFAKFPDSNLMKRMAQRYQAGCWNRLDETGRADTLFAKIGDVWSLSHENPVEFMASLNPGAPQLMEYIRYNADDTLFMRKIMPVAKTVLKDRRVKDKGDWLFMMAFVEWEYNNNLSRARREIGRAMNRTFSTSELKDLARAYKMKLDGQASDSRTLLADLRWLEGKTGLLKSDAIKWMEICENIIYDDILPGCWKRGDYTTAILLCSYADNLQPSSQWHQTWDGPIEYLTFQELRDNEKWPNYWDYSCLSFQLMGSLTSAQLASVYGNMQSDNPLYGFLRRKARNDRDYYYELIGTLALREENYPRAIAYLSKVSGHYIRTMNIDKHGYLSRDPFSSFASRWDVVSPAYDGAEAWEWERSAGSHKCESNPNAKLDFARKMLAYKQTMHRGKSADERGLARLMYAIGRRNSFEECWALTQYWRGDFVGLFELDRGENSQWPDDYSFPYDYESTIGHKATEQIYEREVNAALDMLATDEARAKAQYILGNLKTVVKRYGDTSTARFVKTSCDNWKSWL